MSLADVRDGGQLLVHPLLLLVPSPLALEGRGLG